MNANLPPSAAELRSRIEQRDRFFDLSQDLMCVVGFDGCFKLVNPMWTQLLGWAENELLNQPALRIVHPDDHATLIAARAVVMSGGELGRTEIRYRHKDDSYRWIWWNVFPRPEEQTIYAVGRDVTERKHMETALHSSQQHLADLIDTVDGIVWEAEAATFQFTFVSSQAVRLLGYSVSQWLERPTFWADHVHPEDRERAVNYCAACTRQKQDHEFEYRMLAADGRTVWLRDIVTVVVDNDQPVTLRGLMIDVTEMRLLEAQLRQAQKMEAMGTLASGIAHDFNNILAAVHGYTRLAKTAAGDRADLQGYLDAVLQGADRAAELVKHITAFSRRQLTQRSPVLLQRIVGEVHVLLRATIPATIEIVLSLDDAAPTIFADSTQIHQVIMNLCTNAWQAMRERSGQIRIQVEHVQVEDEFARVHPELKPGPHVMLTVADTGHGMDADILTRIFEPFFTTKGPGGGSGLGLAVADGITRNHQGAIVVNSAPNVGTTFQVYFPAHVDDAIKVGAAVTSEALTAGESRRILFVDDDPLLAQMGEIMLSKLGHSVFAYTESSEAIAALRAAPYDFDVIITDLAMPVKSGIELAEEVRQFRANIPILLVSGYVDTAMHQRIEAAGIQKLLLKPYSVESLGLALQQVFSEVVGQ